MTNDMAHHMKRTLQAGQQIPTTAMETSPCSRCANDVYTLALHRIARGETVHRICPTCFGEMRALKAAGNSVESIWNFTRNNSE